MANDVNHPATDFAAGFAAGLEAAAQECDRAAENWTVHLNAEYAQVCRWRAKEIRQTPVKVSP